MEKETDSHCRVCKGKIVEVVEKSTRLSRDVSKGFHCKDCGIKYFFVPGLKKKEPPPRIDNKESCEPSEKPIEKNTNFDGGWW